MSDESEAILCLAQQVYCQGPNNAQNDLLAIAYGGLAAGQLLYWGPLYDTYNDDLNTKLKEYRADLKCEVEHFCRETFGDPEFPEEAGIFEKGVDMACKAPPERTHFSEFNSKANTLASLYEFETECPVDYRACAAGPAILAMQDFEENSEEAWEVANIEVMAQMSRGSRQLSSEIKSLRQVAIDSCSNLVADAANGINTGLTTIGTAYSLYGGASSG